MLLKLGIFLVVEELAFPMIVRSMTFGMRTVLDATQSICSALPNSDLVLLLQLPAVIFGMAHVINRTALANREVLEFEVTLRMPPHGILVSRVHIRGTAYCI